MKFIILFFTSVLLSTNTYAQVDTVKTYYPNGNLEAVVVYENNIRQGEAIFYWDNGRVKEKRNYVNDRVFGTVTTFY